MNTARQSSSSAIDSVSSSSNAQPDEWSHQTGWWWSGRDRPAPASCSLALMATSSDWSSVGNTQACRVLPPSRRLQLCTDAEQRRRVRDGYHDQPYGRFAVFLDIVGNRWNCSVRARPRRRRRSCRWASGPCRRPGVRWPSAAPSTRCCRASRRLARWTASWGWSPLPSTRSSGSGRCCTAAARRLVP